jgi:hypothetical protein
MDRAVEARGSIGGGSADGEHLLEDRAPDVAVARRDPQAVDAGPHVRGREREAQAAVIDPGDGRATATPARESVTAPARPFRPEPITTVSLAVKPRPGDDGM